MFTGVSLSWLNHLSLQITFFPPETRFILSEIICKDIKFICSSVYPLIKANLPGTESYRRINFIPRLDGFYRGLALIGFSETRARQIICKEKLIN